MKTPTTPYSIAVQESTQITRAFLESEGWILTKEQPLCDSFDHSKNSLLKCSIGLYGHFSIYELHWCNDEPERGFHTINPSLTIEDYKSIIRMLNIKI